MSAEGSSRPSAPWPALLLLGSATGFLSGLFGVGGGILIVPALMLLGIDQRRASGASIAAVLPTAVVGAISYGVSGSVDWLAALLLAAGVITGAQIGTLLLTRLPHGVLFWGFVGLMALVAGSLWIDVPERGDVIRLSVGSGIALVALGLAAGMLSGLFGIGGGIIVVPTLSFLFSASDLVAKGTSLAMIVPGSISATVGNLRRRNVDLAMAAFIGIPASVVSPVGVLTATVISPLASNIAFSVLALGVTAQLVVRHVKKTP